VKQLRKKVAMYVPGVCQAVSKIAYRNQLLVDSNAGFVG
jgi:hypothetical protein